MKSFWSQSRSHCATLVLLLGPVSAQAAPDDVEPPKQAAQALQQFQMDEANFDANVFQPSGNAKQARIQIETKLKLQLDELNRVCGLNDTQQQKLKLAASSDLKRYFDEVAAVRKKVKAGMIDQNAWNNIWQEIQPLRNKQSAGLFGDTSFFAKAVRKTLNDEQNAKYDAVQKERRRFRYRATIEVVMTNMESSVPLRRSQHEAIVKLLLDETQDCGLLSQGGSVIRFVREPLHLLGSQHFFQRFGDSFANDLSRFRLSAGLLHHPAILTILQTRHFLRRLLQTGLSCCLDLRTLLGGEIVADKANEPQFLVQHRAKLLKKLLIHRIVLCDGIGCVGRFHDGDPDRAAEQGSKRSRHRFQIEWFVSDFNLNGGLGFGFDWLIDDRSRFFGERQAHGGDGEQQWSCRDAINGDSHIVFQREFWRRSPSQFCSTP